MTRLFCFFLGHRWEWRPVRAAWHGIVGIQVCSRCGKVNWMVPRDEEGGA